MKFWSVQARKKFHRVSVTWIARILWLFSKAVPYRLGVRAGGVLGWLAYYLLPKERKRAIEHLTLAFAGKGDAWVRRTARRNFVHLGKSMLEVLLITPGRLSAITEFRGLENLRRAHDQGKGVLYVTGHIGNWELSGGVLASQFPLSVVAAPLEPEAVNEFILGLRNRIGIGVILRSRPGAAKELIRIFKQNRVLGLLIDQDTDVDGAFVDFMGRQAWTPTAAASMALKFGAPVVFGYARREKNDRHTVIVEGPLELIRTGDQKQDIVANTALFTKLIEERILQNPEQWVWMHRRWRRLP
jgi:KDO2-lipid IV(A) lauroyltransferase